MADKNIIVTFPEEKEEALNFFLKKKDESIETELKNYLDKVYEKVVPLQVRDYVENRGDDLAMEIREEQENDEEVTTAEATVKDQSVEAPIRKRRGPNKENRQAKSGLEETQKQMKPEEDIVREEIEEKNEQEPSMEM